MPDELASRLRGSGYRLTQQRQLVLAAANANKSGNLFNDPMHNIFLVSGLALGGGLLLGLGIGLPVQTRGAVRRDALDEANAQRRSAIAKGAAQHASLPETGAAGAAPQQPVIEPPAPQGNL